jgi:hypothetical protein
MSKHKSEDYKIIAVKYYLQNKQITIEELYKIIKKKYNDFLFALLFKNILRYS